MVRLDRKIKMQLFCWNIMQWFIVPGPAANLMGSPSLPYLLRQRTAHFSKPSSPSSTGTAQASSVSSPGFVPFEEVLSTLNKALKKLGASEVNKDKLRSRAFYGSHQLEEIQAAIHTFLQNHAGDHEVLIPFKDDSDNFLQILNLLKEKFNSSSSISERVLVLSVLPPSWSRLKIRTEFGSQATNYVISLTKSLVEKHGPFVTPGRKHGRPLSEATVQAVIKFYELDEISSKLMPGCKDYVSVIEDGKRVQKQKRLLLSNLESLYETYKSTHGEENPISFSKFAKLRPKHCVLAGSPGTHSVCVCIYHENVSLMFEGGRFKQASANEAKPLIDFKDCLNELICEEKRPECYLRQCKQCPSGDDLKLRLKRLLNDELMLTCVTYRGWFKVTGRYHLEKVIKPVDDFVEDFMALLFKLLPHHLITKKQSAYYQKVKENLKEGEALIVCDFAENYSCVVQNEVQGYHWTNEQVTIHPFVAYYRDQTGELKSVSYASVTDHKKHMTSTFHAFQKKFVPFLTRKMAEDNITLNKLFYFSDGASAQYKNKKNILNICLHEKDFKIKIEWHFFASCHGKGPCDGVGGCLKRYAARASLQGTIIRNAHEFCEWAKHLPNITTEYLSIEEIEEHILEQAQRAEGLQVVSGIATFHAAIPDSESTVLLKRYSESPHHVIMPLFQTRYFVPWDSLQEYVLVARENTWWVAKIVEKINETNEIRVSYMTPSGRARAYSWPAIIDEATIHWRYILAITVPVIRKNVFTIPVLDKNKADRELKLYKGMLLISKY